MSIWSYTSMLSFSRTSRRPRVGALALALLAPVAAAAQDAPLTLREALALASRGAAANRAADARRDAASARRLATRQALLPAVRVEAGLLRTTDPVGAFGTALRQQRITAADFDPSRLNFPGAANNYSGALILEQPLLVADGWLAARAGTLGAVQAAHDTDWIARSTQADVIAAYYGVALAIDHAATLAVASQAAAAHVRQAERMLEAGLVTKSDVLLASARAGEVEAARLDAARDSAIIRRQLAVLISEPPGALRAVPAAFPPDSAAERTANELLSLSARPRPDVEGARAGAEGAGADVGRARAAFAPRVASFIRRDLNSAARPFGGSSSWTVGLMASWTPFSGAAQVADLRAAEARRAGAVAQFDGVAAAAAADLERSELSLRAALGRLTLTRSVLVHAIEAHRIVGRKYDGGLATVVELLDAAASATQARLALSAARQRLMSAMADRLKAAGHEPARLISLSDASGAVAAVAR